jgi:diguanylate cyclase (GGDEF)-like protein/PAS domain S-box-containing protein
MYPAGAISDGGRMPGATADATADVRHARRGWAAAAAAVALIGVHLVHPDGEFGHITYTAVNLGAAGAAWLGVRRTRFRGIATLIALGITLSVTADAIYTIFEWSGGTGPDVSVADVGWLGSYVALLIGLMRVHRLGGRRLDVIGWADVGSIFVVAMIVQWSLGLDAVATDGTVPVLTRVIWLAYPTLDALLLACIVRAGLDGLLRSVPGSLLAIGAGCWLVSDAVYASVSVSGPVADWLDAGWLGGSVAMAAAIWWSRSPTARSAAAPINSLERIGPTQIALGMCMFLVPSIIGMVAWVQGAAANPIPLAIAMVALVAMMTARSMATVQQSQTDRAELEAQERRASLLAEISSDAVVVVDADGIVLNDALLLSRLVGYDTRAKGSDIFSLVHPADLAQARGQLQRSLSAPGQVFENEIRALDRHGRELWLGVRVVNLLGDPDVGGIVVNLHDITARKAMERQLEHHAFHDALTGLPNRALFVDRVRHAISSSERSDLTPAVLFLDLDGFKTVNDSLGHAAGDALLRVVASRLRDAVRSSESIARLGGDEFAILVETSDHVITDAEAVADRVLQALSEPIELDGQTVSISASLGIAPAGPGADAGSVIRDADVAMYKAKLAGRGRWVVFDTDMRAAAVERLRLEGDLVGALDRGELCLVYQPVVNLETEQVVGFEALLRWRHPELGIVAPDRFIPLAEENGMIVPIGAWVIREACRTAVRWQREFPRPEPITMAVNVSALQLASDDLVPTVAAILEESGLDPRLLVLEMTETELVRDPAVAAMRLDELRTLGLRLAIDDFGTGYSSLSYLRQFPVDILKIDRSFVNSITSRESVPAIVRGLLDLGHTLELEMVAEGVELDLQREGLRAERCQLAQGYLFARPLSVTDAELLLLGLPAVAARPDEAQPVAG